MPLDYFDCFVCGSNDLKQIWTEPLDTDAKNVVGVKTVSLCRCRRCGFIFVNPRPDASSLQRYYGLITDVAWASSVGFDSNLPLFEQGIRQIREYLRTDSPMLLDVGCWTGEFLRLAREGGFEGYGIEVNDLLAAYARECYRLPVLSGTLDEASFSPQSFDVVTMWDVLEHTRQPLETIVQVRDLLKKGGLVVISVPNVTFQLARAKVIRPFRPDVAIAGIAHLNHFSENSITRLLIDLGFEIRHIGVAAPRLQCGWFRNAMKRGYILGASVLRAVFHGNLGNELLMVARKS